MNLFCKLLPLASLVFDVLAPLCKATNKAGIVKHKREPHLTQVRQAFQVRNKRLAAVALQQVITTYHCERNVACQQHCFHFVAQHTFLFGKNCVAKRVWQRETHFTLVFTKNRAHANQP